VPAERFRCTVDDAAAGAARLRGLVPASSSVAADVREIVAAVRVGGDAALLDLERRFGGGRAPLQVTPRELAAALRDLDPAVREGLEMTRANVDAVARASIDAEPDVTLPQGQHVRVRQVPVRRAGVYAPGGQAPYPSSVVMGAVAARAAGVEEVAVCASHPVMLAACALCEVDEVYRMGGAQAIAALAYGTETVPAVDVIVGPGSLYSQEAKRQVLGQVGIDGFEGPSDLLVVCTDGADPLWVALDLRAQAEHGPGTLVAAVSPEPALLSEVAAALSEVDAVAALVHAEDLEAALAFAEALAPEHLQLAGADAEALAPRVRNAGCLFVGATAGAAFGDYVAGSSHVLPTEGAARFASGLGVHHFRRRMAEVRIGDAAGALAPAGAALARAEGFPEHAASMEARMRDDPAPA
jgi:histidinol dehydrogenase